MLSNFFKRRTRGRTAKTDNIEEIQELLTSIGSINSTAEGSDRATAEKCNVNKDEQALGSDKVSSIQKHKRVRTASKGSVDKPLANKNRKVTPISDSKQDVLDNFSFISNASANIDKRGSSLVDESFAAGGPHQEVSPDEHKPFLNEDSAEGDVDLRKIKVMNIATRNIEIKYTASSAALYLPRNFKLLSTLYKILASVHSFNQRRGLTLIFVKYVESIEKLFKHRVEVALLEQLNFICNGMVVFTPMRILDEGIKKDTFKIDVKEGFDIDIALFNYYCELYYKWLGCKDVQGRVSRFHPDFIGEEWSVPRKPFMRGVERSGVEADVREVAKSKASSIVERIKERERERKERFIQECEVKVDYEAKLEGIFSLLKRRAVKLEEIMFKVGGFDCKASLEKAFGERYFVKVINGEEYVVKR